MAMETVKEALLWCVLLNYALLALWFAAFALAHDWMHRLHGRWFALSRERFDTIHYAGMAVYKIGVFLFALVPLIALHLVGD